MRKISNAKLKSLEAKGKVRRKDEPKEPAAPAPAPVDHTPQLAELISVSGKQAAIAQEQSDQAMQTIREVADQLGSGQMMLAEKLQTMVLRNDTKKKPLPYRFTVKRDRKGLIETIDAYPITED